ncbi:MAG TPA: hypothetical protein VH231_21840 [Solirubrobacteraceae bacterium]|nr:hypothetical protein [Solirubrobacteraceae bacterium]
MVDRGDAGLVAPNELDLDDDARTVDGDGDGVATPDIGGYERGLVPGVGGQGGPSTGTSGSGRAPASAGAGASPGAAAADGPVRVLRFGLSRRRFAVGRKRTAVSAARPRRVATGTAFSFALSAPAAARIELARTVRRRGCRRGRRCTRLRPAGRPDPQRRRGRHRGAVLGPPRAGARCSPARTARRWSRRAPTAPA